MMVPSINGAKSLKRSLQSGRSHYALAIQNVSAALISSGCNRPTLLFLGYECELYVVNEMEDIRFDSCELLPTRVM